MKFVEVKDTDMIQRSRRTSSAEIIDLFDAFIESGFKYAEVQDIPKDKALLKTNALSVAAKRYGYGIRVFSRNYHVYLERLVEGD